MARTLNRHLEFLADKDVKQIHGGIYLKRAILKTVDYAKSFPVQDSLYSACYNSELTSYERITSLNEFNF